MKKKVVIKRVLSFFLTFPLLFSILSVSISTVEAASWKGSDFTTGTIAKRLDIIISQGISSGVSTSLPAVGGTFSSSKVYYITFPNRSWGGYQCMAYAYAAYNYIFNQDPMLNCDRFNSLTGQNKLSYDTLNSLGIKFGAYLRTTINSNGVFNASKGHSLLILSYNKSEITVLEAVSIGNGNYTVRIKTQSWDDFNKSNLSGQGRYVCQLAQPNDTVYCQLGGGTQQSSGSYAVTFNANGGSVSTTSKTVTNGSTYGILPTPTRNNYTFDGWYTAQSGGSKITASTSVNLAGNQTLYAHWTYVAPVTVSEKKNPWDFSSTPSRVIYYGNPFITGNDVKWLQQALNDVIDANLNVDGSAGPATGNAIRKFQAQYGLTQDGYFGPDCRSTMIKALNNMGYYSPTPAMTNPWSYSTTPTRAILYKNPIMTGNDIKWLQQALNIVINAGLEVDGMAGPATGNAIKAFQAKYGLSQDGSFGPASRSAMVDALNKLGYTP